MKTQQRARAVSFPLRQTLNRTLRDGAANAITWQNYSNLIGTWSREATTNSVESRSGNKRPVLNQGPIPLARSAGLLQEAQSSSCEGSHLEGGESKRENVELAPELLNY